MEEVTRKSVFERQQGHGLGSIAALGNEYVVALRAVDCARANHWLRCKSGLWQGSGA